VLTVARRIFRYLKKQAAYSGARLPLIPVQSCHPNHFKVATDSGESCHPF